MKNIINIINEEISKFNKTNFYDIDDDVIINHFYMRNFSEEVNKNHLKGFIGKSGKKYVINKLINHDVFKVYLESDINNPIGLATFDENNDYFSGYEHAQSIQVDDNYRRDGIASALIDFAEIIYNKPYKPSNLLSPEMQGLIKNRFNLEN